MVRPGVRLAFQFHASWCWRLFPMPDDTDIDDAVDALRRLQQLGLLDGTDAVVLHRLLAQVVQVQLGSTETLAVAEERIGRVVTWGNIRDEPHTLYPFVIHLRLCCITSIRSCR